MKRFPTLNRSVSEADGEGRSKIASQMLEEIDYPSSDGLPMAETGIHAKTMMRLKQALDDLLMSRNANSYVAIDMNWYWKEGDNKKVKAPDLMVILGIGTHERETFKTWEEGGRVPDVIFEVASKNTWREDLNEKKKVYRRLGVREYFIFDPLSQFVDPPFRVYRLESGYRLEADEGKGLASAVLQLQITPEGTMLRLFDQLTGKIVLTPVEQVEHAKKESQRAKKESQRAKKEKQRADEEKQRAEKEKQRAEKEKQRADEEKQRADEEKQRAEKEKQRAIKERRRADESAAEVARLREMLRQAGISEIPPNEEGS